MRHGNPGAREEVLSGREYLRLPALAANQQLERFAHRNVVVNNEDNRCCARRLAARHCDMRTLDHHKFPYAALATAASRMSKTLSVSLSAGLQGIAKENVAPGPSFKVAHSRPRC